MSVSVVMVLGTTESWKQKCIFTRNSIYAIARICYRPSVRLSVRQVDHRKTVEVRIKKFSQFYPEILRSSPSRGVKQGRGG